jgi:hypothetical protein
MNRHKIKALLHDITRVRTWQLVILLILAGFGEATMLRLDHLEMLRLREEVLRLDQESASREELSRAVTNLRNFVFSHTVVLYMEVNGEDRLVFGSGPFYLESQYVRTAQAEIEKVRDQLAASSVTNPSGDVYLKASAYCDELAVRQGWRSWSKPHIDCVLSELAKYPEQGAIQDLATAMIPPTALYYHDYASPLWAPTPAGWIALLISFLLLVITLRILTSVILRLILRFSRPKSH